MYTSSDDDGDGYYDSYISRVELCGTGPANQQDSTIQDAVNIGLQPNYKSDGRGCLICPLGYLYIPAGPWAVCMYVPVIPKEKRFTRHC